MQIKPINFALAILFTLATSIAAADKPDASISIAGSIASPQSWTVAQLKSAFGKETKTIKYTAKDGPHMAAAIPLYALITAGGPKIDAKIKNHELHFIVAVEGNDGYMATFALTELNPEIGNREAYITLDHDGQPLAERDAPVSLVIPGDQKPERWVRSVKSIRVIEISTSGAATRPS